MKKLLAVLLIASVFMISSCTKDKFEPEAQQKTKVFIRVQSVDNDGSVMYSTIGAVVLQ